MKIGSALALIIAGTKNFSAAKATEKSKKRCGSL
jgi:hypothetical protein